MGSLSGCSKTLGIPAGIQKKIKTRVDELRHNEGYPIKEATKEAVQDYLDARVAELGKLLAAGPKQSATMQKLNVLWGKERGNIRSEDDITSLADDFIENLDNVELAELYRDLTGEEGKGVRKDTVGNSVETWMRAFSPEFKDQSANENAGTLYKGQQDTFIYATSNPNLFVAVRNGRAILFDGKDKYTPLWYGTYDSATDKFVMIADHESVSGQEENDVHQREWVKTQLSKAMDSVQNLERGAKLEQHPKFSINFDQFAGKDVINNHLKMRRQLPMLAKAWAKLSGAKSTVTVVDSVEDLNKIKGLENVKDGVNGVYLPEDGNIYLVADQIESAWKAAVAVVAHEVGHSGLALIKANDPTKYQQMLNGVRAEFPDRFSAVKEAYAESGVEYSDDATAEEILAYHITHNPTALIEARGGVIGTLAKMFRTIMHKLTNTPSTIKEMEGYMKDIASALKKYNSIVDKSLKSSIVKPDGAKLSLGPDGVMRLHQDSDDGRSLAHMEAVSKALEEKGYTTVKRVKYVKNSGNEFQIEVYRNGEPLLVASRMIKGKRAILELAAGLQEKTVIINGVEEVVATSKGAYHDYMVAELNNLGNLVDSVNVVLAGVGSAKWFSENFPVTGERDKGGLGSYKLGAPIKQGNVININYTGPKPPVKETPSPRHDQMFKDAEALGKKEWNHEFPPAGTDNAPDDDWRDRFFDLPRGYKFAGVHSGKNGTVGNDATGNGGQGSQASAPSVGKQQGQAGTKANSVSDLTFDEIEGLVDNFGPSPAVDVDPNGTVSTSPMLSIRTLDKTILRVTQNLNKQAKNSGAPLVDAATVSKYFQDANNIARLITSNPDLLDFAPSEAFSAVKSNSDPAYKKSLDFTTMCVKRYIMQSTIDAIQLKIGKFLTAEDYMVIRKMLMDKKVEYSCGACYVDSRRINMATVLKKAAEGYTRKQGEIVVTDKEDNILFEGPKAEWVKNENFTDTGVTVTENKVDVPIPPLKVPKEMLLTMEGITVDMPAKHPEEYAKFRKLFGGTQIKIPEARTEYRGEIAKLSDAMVKTMNRASGMRWQSWSDFEVPHLLDAMEAIGDMAVKGLKGQAYTKQVNFVRALARTGMAINMSMIPKGNGFDEKGNLIWDETQSFPWEQAKKFRKEFDNVGTIAIGVSDEHIKALLAHPDIDYVIPYHASGLSQEYQKLVGMGVNKKTGEWLGWTDYAALKQVRRGAGEGWRSAASNKKLSGIDKMVFINEYKGDLKELFRLAEERGSIPPFQAFKDWPGYEKLITDRRIFKRDGSYYDQQPVQPVFDSKELNKIIKEYRGTETKPDMDVVKEFMKGGGPKLSLAYPLAPKSEWYGDSDYEARGAKMTTMTPDEYLSSVRPLKMDDESRENIDDLKTHIQAGKTLDPLAIYDDGSEDGRHRAVAAKELGIKEVPVIRFTPRYSLASRFFPKGRPFTPASQTAVDPNTVVRNINELMGKMSWTNEHTDALKKLMYNMGRMEWFDSEVGFNENKRPYLKEQINRDRDKLELDIMLRTVETISTPENMTTHAHLQKLYKGLSNEDQATVNELLNLGDIFGEEWESKDQLEKDLVSVGQIKGAYKKLTKEEQRAVQKLIRKHKGVYYNDSRTANPGVHFADPAQAQAFISDLAQAGVGGAYATQPLSVKFGPKGLNLTDSAFSHYRLVREYINSIMPKAKEFEKQALIAKYGFNDQMKGLLRAALDKSDTKIDVTKLDPLLRKAYMNAKGLEYILPEYQRKGWFSDLVAIMGYSESVNKKGQTRTAWKNAMPFGEFQRAVEDVIANGNSSTGYQTLLADGRIAMSTLADKKALKELLAAYRDTIQNAKIDKAVKSAKKDIVKLRRDIRTFKKRMTETKGYVPRVREEGEYWVKVMAYDEDGELARKTPVYYKLFKTKTDADRVAAGLNKHGAKSWLKHNKNVGVSFEASSGRVELDSHTKMMGYSSDVQMQAFINEAMRKEFAENEKLTPADAERLRRDLSNQIAEISMTRGFGRHRVRRNKDLIEGYVTDDIYGVLNQYVSGMAGSISKAIYAGNIISRIASEGDSETKAWAREFARDTLAQSTRLDENLAVAKQAVTFLQLGLNLTTAFVNSLQNVVIGQAILSEHAKSPLMKLGKSAMDIWGGNTSEEEAKALHRAMRRGLAAQNILDDIRGNEGSTMKGKFATGVGKLTNWGLTPMQFVEHHINREPAFLAGYRVFRDGNNLDRNGIDPVAVDKAMDFVNTVHFLAGKVNLPPIARGDSPTASLFRAIFTLQSYSLNLLNLVGNRMVRSAKGDTKAMESLFRIMAALMILGGSKSMLGVDELNKLMRRWTGKDYKLEVENQIREHGFKGFADFLGNGIFGLAGVNLSNSMAIRVPVVSNLIDNYSKHDSPGEYLMSLTGIFGSRGKNIDKALAAFDRGMHDRALEMIAPNFFANLMAAGRGYGEGLTTMTGKKIFDADGQQVQFTAQEAILKALGANPMAQAKRTELEGSFIALDKEWKLRKTNVQTKVRDAFNEGDMDKARELIRNHNEAVLKSQLSGSKNYLITSGNFLKDSPNKPKLIFQRKYTQ